MEYCEESLPHKKQPNDVAVAIIYEIAQALGYAHQKNIIHGDIKTSNIMIKKGVYKISDWGLSKVTTDGSVTLSGATPQYAAPEQISREFGRSDERTDVYQLGTVFYELLTGKVPFEGEMSEIYGSILTTIPEPTSEINPESADLEPIVMKCLSKVKDERYSSMSELQKDLEEYYTPISMDETVIFREEPDDGKS
jgi:serine/threonine protein kinase